MKYLRDNIRDIAVEELDEMLISINGGVWPSDEPYRNQVLLPRVIKEILAKDIPNYIFFTSYMSLNDLKEAKKNGYTIIQLFCSNDILVSRNILKDESREFEMRKNLEYQKDLENKNILDRRIDTNMKVEEIVEEILG